MNSFQTVKEDNSNINTGAQKWYLPNLSQKVSFNNSYGTQRHTSCKRCAQRNFMVLNILELKCFICAVQGWCSMTLQCHSVPNHSQNWTLNVTIASLNTISFAKQNTQHHPCHLGVTQHYTRYQTYILYFLRELIPI